MGILVIQGQADLREQLVLALEIRFGCEVFQAGTLADAITVLQNAQGKAVSLVVYDYESASSIELEALQNAKPDASCVLRLDKNAPSVPNLQWNIVSVVDRSEALPGFLENMQKLAEEEAIDLGFEAEDFCKIRTQILLSVCPLGSDVFIRLSESKFVKIFHQGDAFEPSDLDKYTVKKGIEHLYIRKGDVGEFIQKYNSGLQQTVMNSQTLTLENLAKVHESIYETAQEIGQRIGFNADVQFMAKAHMQLTMKAMGKNPRLSSVIDRIRAYGGKYIGAHSGILGFLACSIATHMEWASETTFQKLTLAAFLHDIALTNHELAACNTIAEAEAGKFTEKELAQFKEHPILGAEVARHFHEVPPDVDTIIVQHHERPDSGGFPRHLSYSYIAPLSAVFIVAHDLTQYFLSHSRQLDIPDFMTFAREKYPSSRFRKVLDAIEKL